jgi:hypothetical protein
MVCQEEADLMGFLRASLDPCLLKVVDDHQIVFQHLSADLLSTL